MKIVWRVRPEPTGLYRSFEKRGWPTATFNDPDGLPAAQILSEDDYDPQKVKSGDHAELKIAIADYRVIPWRWRGMTKRAKTLKEAKLLVSDFYKSHPEFLP